MLRKKRPESRKLKIALTGDSFSPIATEAAKRFPKAKLYERSDAMTEARRNEARLGRKHGDRDFKRLAKDIEKALRRKHRFDVEIRVHFEKPRVAATVKVGKCSKTIKWNMVNLRQMEEFEAKLSSVMDAVSACLR